MGRLQSKMKYKKYYHVSPTLTGRTWGSLTLEYRWQILAVAFRRTQKRIPFEIHSFVMMGTHFHLLFSVLKESPFSAEQVMKEYHIQLLILLEPAPGVLLLEEPFVFHDLITEAELLNTYRYIYRNPKDAEIALEARSYPYSTLPEVLGLRPKVYPTVDPLSLISSPQKILDWIEGDSPRLFSPTEPQRDSEFNLFQKCTPYGTLEGKKRGDP